MSQEYVMFSTIYFAASSILSSAEIPAALATKLLDGRILEAAHAAADLAEFDEEAGQQNHAALQIHGDIELVLGRYEEAEDIYRRAQKAIRHSRDTLRIVSCRNTGWQAFFRNRFGVALICFKRTAEDKAITPNQRLDAMIGVTLVLFHLGCIQAAYDRLVELTAQARANADARWAYLVDALRRDLLAQHKIHCAEHLADHIYWRSVEFDPALAQHDTQMPAAGGAFMPLLAQRLDYLRELAAFADGDNKAAEALRQYASHYRKIGLTEYHRSLCLEIALAGVASRATAVAQAMLEVSGAAAAQGAQHTRWYLDYLYCRAKIMQQQMHVQEFAQLYSRYAFASIQHVRADNVSMPTMASDRASPSATRQRSDDVSARLPAKYRRAYRYLMDNLDQKDLSVREVASYVGVTERAMQAAFKNHLGLSPSELIRRQRMERIRDDLLDDDAPVAGVLDVAKKWGVQHRSTLINGYRSVFHEAPSATLGR
jgi:AraC-like DNA-binding protein